MAKKRNIESASVFERSGIRAIRVRAIEVLLYKVVEYFQSITDSDGSVIHIVRGKSTALFLRGHIAICIVS